MHDNADEASKNHVTEALQCVTAKIVCSIGEQQGRISCGDRLGALKACFWIEGGWAVLCLAPPFKCAHHALYHLRLCATFEVR